MRKIILFIVSLVLTLSLIIVLNSFLYLAADYNWGIGEMSYYDLTSRIEDKEVDTIELFDGLSKVKVRLNGDFIYYKTKIDDEDLLLKFIEQNDSTIKIKRNSRLKTVFLGLATFTISIVCLIFITKKYDRRQI